jgi:DNA-binding SARP family transcriptional activator
MEVTDDLEFLVLGPLEVRRGQRLVPVRGWREQALLAMLLLADGEAVTVERLVAAIWDDAPPSGAVKAVRNCASSLRRRLAESGRPLIPIQATPAGYRLPLDGARLDAREFQRQVDTARRLAGGGLTARAASGLRRALSLWRGPALAGTGGRIVQDCAARLDEQRISAVEDCLDLELALGRHRRVVGELQTLVQEYPLRERVTGQLMLALYQSGRQAEALGTYLQLAKRLAEDLGIDPAADVTRLYEAILRQDPSLSRLPGPVPGSRPPAGRRGQHRWHGTRRPSPDGPANWPACRRCSRVTPAGRSVDGDGRR